MNKKSLKTICLIILITLISINIFSTGVVVVSSETTGGISVSEALNQQQGTTVTVEGYIISGFNEQYAIKIADTNNTSASEYLIVKLEASMREEFSPVNNPNALGKKVKVTGKRDLYSGEQSVEYVSYIEFIDGSTSNGSVSAALKEQRGTIVTVEGYIISGFNEQYAIKIADTNNTSASEYLIVKLEASMREEFSPVNNPNALGKKVKVTGKRDVYSGEESIEYVSSIEFVGDSVTEAYNWNNVIPEKKPSPEKDNGKLILFNNSHGETSGNADWVIDGGFSDFADALVNEGYTVKEYRGIDKNGDGVIRYYDDRQQENVNINETIITYDAIKNADVFIMAESNRPLKKSEYAALKQFVESGKGVYFIADHYNADRNKNTWDSTEVFNGYNRSTSSSYNMGGEYGDMRNPQDANKGWLSETFGIRFRFNGLDCKSGVSGIKSTSESEGITQGVEGILMAAGGTLAITDPDKAKGIVYFAESDIPVKWNYAPDSGIYFGGEKEGPFVAISKPSQGKAAFIGDSSPIEDATPKYKREDGGTKKTYPGWTETGNAATLSINIVNWLATQESYIGFDGVNHTKGVLTPEAMAEVEMDETQTEPWSVPTYDPWNTDTFAPGSYGAPYE
ncbi:DUF6359 domain-containing protein [Wukongibacter sp. M2B1]|uniref:DUF6359 domain-containing protein n=1 Tax=Wukongibacter sp. M2B1 TaxID=3088895 RepID=UPI003D7B666E